MEQVSVTGIGPGSRIVSRTSRNLTDWGKSAIARMCNSVLRSDDRDPADRLGFVRYRLKDSSVLAGRACKARLGPTNVRPLGGSGRSCSLARVTVAQLEEEDGAGEPKGGAVGDDDRQLALPEAVGQPQAEAGDEHQEHAQRDVPRGVGAPDAQDLRQEGAGGAEGGGVAGPVEEGHRESCFEVSGT